MQIRRDENEKITIAGIVLVMMFLFGSIGFAFQQVNLMKIGLHTDESTINPYSYVFGYPGLDTVNLVYDNLFHSVGRK